MRSLLMKACIAALGSIAITVGAAAPVSASGGLAKIKTKPVSLNVCGIPSGGQLAEAEVDEPCKEAKTGRVPVKKSPLGGTAGSVVYGAQWGLPKAPSPALGILATQLLGSGKAVKEVEKEFRGKVLSHGQPVKITKDVTASLDTETSACVNPPTGVCVAGSFFAIAGSWVVEVYLDDYPPTIPGSNEEETSAAAMQADGIAEEEKIKPALASIGLSVLAKV
jgi:hypothetical protein